MVSDRMGQLFEELGKRLNIKITPDLKGSCRIRFKGGVEVQMEQSSNGRYLTLLCNMGEIAPGKYRENVLREALKANGRQPPLYGIFSFSKKQNIFYLFDQVPLDDLSGTRLFEFVQPFLEKAQLWKSAVARGEVPTGAVYSRSGGGMFGL